MKIELTDEAVKYLNKQRVLTSKLNHFDTEWYSFLLFGFIANQIKPYLKAGNRSLDIGSGLGLVNVFLRDYYKEIWLYDKDCSVKDLDNVYYGFHDNYCYYNNLKIAKEINPDFKITESLDQFDKNSFDMIQSHMSWCWHYPKEVYYNRVLELLKPNGILIVDVWVDKKYSFDDFKILNILDNREEESKKYVLQKI